MELDTRETVSRDPFEFHREINRKTLGLTLQVQLEIQKALD